MVSRSRLAAAGAALLVAGSVLAACGSGNPSAGTTSVGGSTAPTTSGPTTTSTTPPTTTVPALAHGVQGAYSAIPWSEVGPGWTLATWQASASAAAPSGDASLFLVDPAGGRYLVSSSVPAAEPVVAWSASTKKALLANWFASAGGADLTGVDLATGTTIYQTHLEGVGFSVAAQSGDGTRVLVTSDIVNTSNNQVLELDLSSGATLHQFKVDGPANVSYTLPQGLALVISSGNQLRRAGLDGTTQLAFPTSFSTVGTYNSVSPGYDPFLYTPDGTEVVMGATKGLAVVLNSGTVERQLPVPASGQGQGCVPVEWWSGGSAILASCTAGQGNEYWTVPLSGATPTMLGEMGPVFGDLYAAGGGVFAQSGACGTEWVDSLAAGGTFSQINVPGLQPSEVIIGSTPAALEVLGRGACDESPGQVRAFALVSFEPASDTSSFQLGPSVNGGTVLSAVADQPLAAS